MNEQPQQIAQDTSRVMDITGAESTLILLAEPGEDVTACGGLIAEASARGRRPFVVILSDAATDSPATPVPRRQLASRTACKRLGLPDDQPTRTMVKCDCPGPPRRHCHPCRGWL